MDYEIKRYNISGLRGVIGETLTPLTLYYNILSFIKYLEKRSFYKGEKKKIRLFVGRDARNSGDSITSYILGLLNLFSIDVDFGGVIPTPTVLHQIKIGQYDGGIAITASHNPIKYNAIKLVKFGGYFLDLKDIEEMNLYFDRLLKDKNHPSADFSNLGSTRLFSNAYEYHIDKALSHFDVELIKKRRLKVAVDFCNSTAANVFPSLFNKLNVEYNAIFDKISGKFEREPEPNRETMQYLSSIMKESSFDVGFVFDPDADRVAILFENGYIPSEEYTLALSYLHYCKNKGGGDCVVNLSTSSMIRFIADKYRFNVYFAPVGEINVTNKMLENRINFGGEGNGGVIYLPVSNSRDTIVAVLFILELIAKEEKKLSIIANEIPQYNMRKYKIDRTNDFDNNRILNVLNLFEKNQIKVLNYDSSDGVRFNLTNGFCHIRASNTEPVIRVIIENSDVEEFNKLQSLIDEIKLIF